MQKIKLINLKELSEKKQVIRKILGKTYLIQKKDNGCLVFEYTCRHQGADLSVAPEKNGILTCPRHGWQYNKYTGECIKGNGEPLKKCSVEIIDENIFLITGSSEEN